MQIVIDIDIEAIVRDEIRAFIQANLVINNVKGAVTTVVAQEAPKPVASSHPATETKDAPAATAPAKPAAPAFEPEFAPKLGKRRTKAEMAMHEKELELGRNLTPEEKGEVTADVEMADEREAKAKADRKQQKAAEKTVAEVTAEIEAEAAQEGPGEASSDGEGTGTLFMQEPAPRASKPTVSGGLFDEPAPDAPAAMEETEEAAEAQAEAEDPEPAGEAETAQESEETAVPKTEDLGNLNSLFS